MEKEKPKTKITIDVRYDVLNPPPKGTPTHVEIDSSYLPKLKKFAKQLNNLTPVKSPTSDELVSSEETDRRNLAPAKPDSSTEESKLIGTDGSPNGSETGGRNRR